MAPFGWHRLFYFLACVPNRLCVRIALVQFVPFTGNQRQYHAASLECSDGVLDSFQDSNFSTRSAKICLAFVVSLPLVCAYFTVDRASLLTCPSTNVRCCVLRSPRRVVSQESSVLSTSTARRAHFRSSFVPHTYSIGKLLEGNIKYCLLCARRTTAVTLRACTDAFVLSA